MKFDCGPSPEAKREAWLAVSYARRAEREKWHPWFAWFPVRLGEHDCRFWEQVERRQRYRYPNLKLEEYWEYRPMQTVHRLTPA